jgi:histidinol-phosphate aminotransferase
MADRVTDATKLVILCSPNNPTGPALREADVRTFLQSIPDDVLVVLDEAYAEFVDDPEAVDGRRLLADHPNLAVLRTFSKAYGLAGLRVGYCLAGSPDTAAALRQVQVPFSVSLPAQAAALASLDAEAELRARVEAVMAEREPLRTALRDLGYDVPPAQGNFVWLPTGADTMRVAQVFDDNGVLVRPRTARGSSLQRRLLSADPSLHHERQERHHPGQRHEHQPLHLPTTPQGEMRGRHQVDRVEPAVQRPHHLAERRVVEDVRHRQRDEAGDEQHGAGDVGHHAIAAEAGPHWAFSLAR